MSVTVCVLGALLFAQVAKEQTCDGTTGKCAAVINTTPTGTEYGQVVRVLGGGVGGGGTSSSYGAAFPATGTAAGFKDSTGSSMVPGNLDVAGNLAVTVKDAAGRDLDLRQESENWNAADHGILVFGHDTASVPNKYRSLKLDASGSLSVNLSNVVVEGNNADAEAVRSSGILEIESYPMVFNGTSWDRQRGDTTSGAWVNVKNTSLAVTGTFWQTTQPVSGPLTDTQLRASAVPVSGTFWQATQPVLSKKAAANTLATAVSVTTSATALPGSPLGSRVSVCAYNNGSETVFLGGSGVTTSSGFPLPAGGSFCDDMGAQVLYGIAVTGPVNVRVIEN